MRPSSVPPILCRSGARRLGRIRLVNGVVSIPLSPVVWEGEKKAAVPRRQAAVLREFVVGPENLLVPIAIEAALRGRDADFAAEATNIEVQSLKLHSAAGRRKTSP